MWGSKVLQNIKMYSGIGAQYQSKIKSQDNVNIV